MAITELKNPSKLTPFTNKPALFWVGLFLVLVSLLGISLIFAPIIKNEIKYMSMQRDAIKNDGNNGATSGGSNLPNLSKKPIVAVDENFSIVIPKIGANSKVIEEVDYRISSEYQKALSQGVAHAKDTPSPKTASMAGEGNTFLFAHSSDSFFTANQYNSVFYLLTKLKTNDYFYIAFDKKLYKYEIIEKKIVSASEIKYLSKIDEIDGKKVGVTATLMTCWPAGTTYKRLVVVGKLVN
ncbi:sortase [candidate division WWE3 bacterium]|nr:sortase [candidate division WWE3 bacterium]